MMDRKEVNDILNAIQITLSARIRRLAETSELVESIRAELDKDEEFLKRYIKYEAHYRDLLGDSNKQLGETEKEFWDKLLRIVNE